MSEIDRGILVIDVFSAPELVMETAGSEIERNNFEIWVVGELLGVDKRLQVTYGAEVGAAFWNGLEEWFDDEQHGMRHSMDVFNKAREIRELEGLESVSDGDLLVRAVIHDMAEFMPIYREKNGKLVESGMTPEEKRNRHPELMAEIVLELGRKWGVEDAKTLAIDIKRHDFNWSLPSQRQMDTVGRVMSPAGKILADADRMVLDESGAVGRNRVGSLGRWYILRPDMTAEDRVKWQSRTGGLFDGVSAILREITMPDRCFFTEVGKQLNRERAERARRGLTEYYRDQYHEGWEVLGGREDNETLFGLRTKKDGEYLFSPMSDEDLDKLPEGFWEMGLRDKMKAIMEIPVRGKAKDGREYYGYSMYIDGKWLDPSVLVYESVEELEGALGAAIDGYSARLANM